MSEERSLLRFWVILLATAMVVSAGVGLGFWQLSRADQKMARSQALDAAGKEETVDNALWLGSPSRVSLTHRVVRLSGQWLADQTIFLDNRQMNGRPGFYVLGVFLPNGSNVAVVVQRGWAPRHFLDRSALPAVPVPVGQQVLAGRVAPVPAKLYDFNAIETGPIRQNIDLAVWSTQARSAGLVPFVTDVSLVQFGDSADGLLRQWALPDLGVGKHKGYAVQWFSLAALVFFIFVWFQIVLPFRQHRAKNH